MKIRNEKAFLVLLLAALVVLAFVADSRTRVTVLDDNKPRLGKASREKFTSFASAVNPTEQITLPWVQASCSIPKLPRYLKYKESKLSPIRNQGTCASCWSIGVTGMLADRISVYTDGAINEELSNQEMISCWDGHQNKGCSVGGIPELAYEYVVKHGIALEKDFPYAQEFTNEITPCDKAKRSGRRVFAQPGSAVSLCKDPYQFKESSVQYNNTVAENVENMKRELFLRGPIVGTLMIHESTYDYDGMSVYKGSKEPGDKFIGGHVIIISGFSEAGVNTGEPGFDGNYWICKQSWGPEFPRGSRHAAGYMFVEMGTNCSGIESRASACMPVISSEISAKLAASLDSSRFVSYEAYKCCPAKQNFVRRTTWLGGALGLLKWRVRQAGKII